MEYLAHVELGMSSKDFYDCTWSEWSLWLEKIRVDRKKRLMDHEVLMDMTRRALTFYYNWNTSSEARKLEPQDFWPLSYDKAVDNTVMAEDEKQKLAETIKRLESKSRKKRG